MKVYMCGVFIYTLSVANGFLVNFCQPNFCFLRCSDGYETYNGCPICKCKQSQDHNRLTSVQSPFQSSGSSSSFAGPSSYPQNYQVSSGSFSGPQINIQGSTYHNPCTPSQSYCPLKCSSYMTGANGCQYCLCNQGIQETTMVTTTFTTHAPVKLPKPCMSSETTCDKQCKYGFLIGPGGCQYCICSPYLHQVTTELPTTTTTTLSSVLMNPCVPSQKCILSCDHGFVHGSSGCQYCVCNPNTTKGVSSTTVAPLKTTNNPLSEQCTIAIAICQVKCRTGFMTDPNDCTFCRCKAEIETALQLPHTNDIDIKLMKPCLVEFDSCNIFCAHGYLRGPDYCQFCACAH